MKLHCLGGSFDPAADKTAPRCNQFCVPRDIRVWSPRWGLFSRVSRDFVALACARALSLSLSVCLSLQLWLLSPLMGPEPKPKKGNE